MDAGTLKHRVAIQLLVLDTRPWILGWILGCYKGHLVASARVPGYHNGYLVGY